MAKNDWRKRKLDEGGKNISVTLVPAAAQALEELMRKLKRPEQTKGPSQSEVISRVLVWGLKEFEAGRKGGSPKDSTTQEESSSIPQELEARLVEIETRLARVESSLLASGGWDSAI